MTAPLCQRLTELDTGPIVGVIRAVARGEHPEQIAVEEAQCAAFELSRLNFIISQTLKQIEGNALTQIEALAMLQDEPIKS